MRMHEREDPAACHATSGTHAWLHSFCLPYTSGATLPAGQDKRVIIIAPPPCLTGRQHPAAISQNAAVSHYKLDCRRRLPVNPCSERQSGRRAHHVLEFLCPALAAMVPAQVLRLLQDGNVCLQGIQQVLTALPHPVHACRMTARPNLASWSCNQLASCHVLMICTLV